MNKVLCVAVLLLGGALALSFGSSGSAYSGPHVIAKVSLVNQTSEIPNTTLLTVPETGLYRVTAYMANNVPAGDAGIWDLYLYWADGVGAEDNLFCQLPDYEFPPQAYGYSPAGDPANCGMTVKALRGTPLSYSVNSQQGASCTYEVSLVVERLE